MVTSPLPIQRRPHADDDRTLSTLCHDLRQYLSAGLLLTTVPDESCLDGETARRFELLHQTLSHATALLESATADSMPRLETINLSDMAQECVDVAEFGHKVRLVSEAGMPPLVDADPLLLHRALGNMIDNAGRAAGEDGDILVRVGCDGAQAWVEVIDDGPGFGEISHGSGQGLSVVSSTARSCGGRLEISSGPGPGTTVRLVFPLVPLVRLAGR